MSFLDHFSGHATEYAKYRPDYPPALFEYLAGLPEARRRAWDVGTGSGQAASGLAHWFRRVVATDPSGRQVAHARRRDNIGYAVARAEDVVLRPGTVDLVTVGQALHWIETEPFYAAVRHAAAPGGVLAVWTYDLPRVTPGVDAAVDQLYRGVLQSYWSPRRKAVEEHYETVPFPFPELPSPTFAMRHEWTLADFVGYLQTWSGVRRYWERHGRDPMRGLRHALCDAWGRDSDTRFVTWPLFLRVGRVDPR
jgi:hypothetical protein